MTDEEAKARLKEQAESDAHFFRNNRPGGWLWETVVVVALAAVFFLYCFPPCIPARQKSREAEAKANLHAVQVAIERYAVDNKTYPPFLYGGDVHSTFTTGRSSLDPREEGHGRDLEFSDYNDNPRAIPGDCDVLLQYGYLDEYPKNPFSPVPIPRDSHLVTDPRDAPKSRIKLALSNISAVPRAGCAELGDINNWQFALPRCPAGIDGRRMWDVSEGGRHAPFAVLAPGERAGGLYAPPAGFGSSITADMHDDTGAEGLTVNESDEPRLHPHLPGNFYYYPVVSGPRGWTWYYAGTSGSFEAPDSYRMAIYGAADNGGQDVYDMFGDFEDRQIKEYIDDQNTPGVDVPNLGGPDGRADGVQLVLSSAADYLSPDRHKR